jgi:hypothetical protein
LKEKRYFPLSLEHCDVTKLAVEGALREFRINEECFRGRPLIQLPLLFNLQVDLI